MLLAQRLAILVAWVAGLILGSAALDYLLRLPGTARLLLLVAGAGALGYALWTYVRPAVRFRPGLTQLALRAERGVCGRRARQGERPGRAEHPGHGEPARR